MKTRVNRKKNRRARRQRPDYPQESEFQVVSSRRHPDRYIALRSDGAVVTRKSPEAKARDIAIAKAKKIRRESEANKQTTLFNDPKVFH